MPSFGQILVHKTQYYSLNMILYYKRPHSNETKCLDVFTDGSTRLPYQSSLSSLPYQSSFVMCCSWALLSH